MLDSHEGTFVPEDRPKGDQREDNYPRGQSNQISKMGQRDALS